MRKFVTRRTETLASASDLRVHENSQQLVHDLRDKHGKHVERESQDVEECQGDEGLHDVNKRFSNKQSRRLSASARCLMSCM
jgi:hypothetical protein